MQSMPMYVGSAAAAPSSLGSSLAAQPSRCRNESELSARLRLLAEPMKVDLQPAVSRALTAPPGLEGLTPMPGSFSRSFKPPAAPPGLADLQPAVSRALAAPPGLDGLTPMTGSFSRSFEPPAAPPGLAMRKTRSDESAACCSTSAGLDGEASEASSEAEESTTMAILNLPYTFPKCKLQRMMESEGYTFNYFHFPRDSRKGRNRGFAFVNFATVEMAQTFRYAFDKMTLFHSGEKEKSITVVPSSLQGFESNRALHPGAAAGPQMQREY